MNFEEIGTIASIIVLISFLCKSERKIRIINIIGALLFVVYGALNGRTMHNIFSEALLKLSKNISKIKDKRNDS